MGLKRKALVTLTLLTVALPLISCGGGQNEIDYVHNGDVQLKLDYANKDFYKDGICEVELKTCIDGDTAHFTPKTGTTDYVKARFYGIDTPESTGAVQPYGRKASSFTKEKLNNAAKNGTIVLASGTDEYGAPKPDSTGQRYVTCIWINETKKSAPKNELYLLNLWLVQEGLANCKNLSEYHKETFLKAVQQAEAFKKNLFSGQPDPDFNYGGYEDVSLLEIKREIEAGVKDPTHVNKFDNANVRVQGTVVGYANSILYLQNYYTEEESGTKGGEFAGINIYTGAASIPNPDFTVTNTYIEVCGNASNSENFGFQITDASFPIVPYSKKDAKIILTPEQNTDDPRKGEGHKYVAFDLTASEANTKLGAKDTTILYSPVNISEALKVKSVTMNETGKTFTLKFENYSNLSVFIPFQYQPYPDDPLTYWKKPADFFKDGETMKDGHSFTLKEVIYTLHQGKSSSGEAYSKFQLAASSSLNVVLVD